MLPSEIIDYVCFYDEQDRLVIELDPEQFDTVSKEEETPKDPFTRVINIPLINLPKELLDEI